MLGLPGGARGEEPPARAGDMRHGFDPWVGKTPWRRARLSTPVFLPGESHGQKSLVGYSPWGCKKSDTTERLSVQPHRMQTQLLCIERCAERAMHCQGLLT